MIPYNTITAWGVSHPWATREQVEQDMLLSRAICDIYNNELLAEELVFRGGTALNKLILKEPYRYSEDLDFVRTSAGGIGDIMKELTNLGQTTGYQVKTKIGQFPKLFWLTTAQTGLNMRIKIEINTQERTSALPIADYKHTIQSDWYSGDANVKSYQLEEIAATKIRALYQRSKGRDLFDLWLLTTEVGVDVDRVFEAFSVYRPIGFTGKKGVENLELKIRSTGFISDMDNLISPRVDFYDPESAAEIIISRYLRHP
jgi:predicted nucleotidyltransferase component of viral defense system